MSHLLSGGPIVRVCVCVCPCWSLSVLLLVRMTHPLSAACQVVSSFVRWTICACACVCPCWSLSVLLLVRMTHPLSAACQALSHLSSGGPIMRVCACVPCLSLLVLVGPFASQDDPALSTACQALSRLSSGGPTARVCVCVCPLFVLVGPFASQDDPSFVSSLPYSLIFRQVDHCACMRVCVSLLVLLLVRMTHPLSAACQDVSSFVRWTDCACMCACVSLLVLVGLFASQDDPPFVSSLSRCLNFSQLDHLCVCVCMCVCVCVCVCVSLLVPVGPFMLIRMTHPLSAACQALSHLSSGEPIVRVCACVPCLSLSVLLLVRMTHPLSAACQVVSSFVRWTNCACMCVCATLLVLVGPFASQDDPSFVSSLSRCLIFRQVDLFVCVLCVHFDNATIKLSVTHTIITMLYFSLNRCHSS